MRSARFLFKNMSWSEAFYSLGRKINKFGGNTSSETEEGVVSEQLPELKLEMEDSKITDLTQKWEKSWRESAVYSDWKKKSEENENYWLGIHFERPEGDKTRPLVDNVIFESLETYLPQVTRRNPEPMVALSSAEEKSSENLAFVKSLQDKLGELADENKIRLKLKKSARHWAIYLIGVQKYGWDLNRDIPTVKAIRPQKLILDPEATIDEDGYTGEFIGEYRKLQASSLLKIIGKEDETTKKVVTEAVKDNLGTELQFIEWWTDEYMCWTMGKHVLLKRKNPHWNYDSEQPGQTEVDDYGNETQGAPVLVKGTNHFPVPKKPFSFLVVFNLGKQPVDETSLIGQNLANQDRVNKRSRQIDKNADDMNGGMVVSLERSGLNSQQAERVTKAIRKGGVVAIPTGSPDDAVKRYPANSLPADVYNDLVDVRSRMRDIFGTRGSTPAGIESETTVRGKILSRGLDTDRIGGGISEYLEQMADEMYNWMLQMLYVYDESFQGITPPKVTISVKEGSLLPKDSTTIANQAIELANAGKMSTVDLYRRLDYPNPDELAANIWLETNAPELLFKDNPLVQEAIAMKQEAQANASAVPPKPPSTSISFKDLPPDAQAQLAAQAGIQMDPEAVAAFRDNETAKEANRSALSEQNFVEEELAQ